MRKILTVVVVAATIPGAAIATSSNAEAWRGGWGWGPGAVVGGVIAGAVVGSAIASGPYYYPYGGTTDITDTDHIPITDPPAAACGTVTPGYPLVSYELDGGGGFAIFTAICRASSLVSSLAAERRPGSSS